MNKLNFIFISIIQFCLIASQIAPGPTKKTQDYFGVILRVIEGLERDCFPQIRKIFDQEKSYPEANKSYPWLGDAIGKNLNDIGDELECVKSIPNTSFIMVNIYRINLTRTIQTIDYQFLDYLEIDNFTIGFCVMKECKLTVRRYTRLLSKYLLKDLNAKNEISYIENDRFDKNSTDNVYEFENNPSYKSKFALFIIFCVFAGLKAAGAILRLIFLQKGYDKYMVEKMNNEKLKLNAKELEQDVDEKINLTQKPNNIEPLIKEEDYSKDSKEYNPLYDFSDKLPWYLKLLKFFDLWDDLYIISSKRNKYFNDTGLDVINFNRAIVICSLVFSSTFSTLISLPSEEIMNKTFFGSPLNIFFRLSQNSYVCWAFLEGAHTTYKLLCFISSEMFRYYAKEGKNNVNFYAKLLIIYAKFLILLIPKILEFIGVYFIYYFSVRDYSFFTDAKATFIHIVNHLFTKNIKCNTFPDLFTQFTVSLNISEYGCYKFVYFYFDMLISILISMVLIFLFFLIKQPIFEFIIIIGNFVYMFTIINKVYDKKIDTEVSKKFLLYHMNGQEYTEKILWSFNSVYNLGLFTGIILFNFNGTKNILQRLIYENYLKYFSKIEEISKIELDNDSESSDKEGGIELVSSHSGSVSTDENILKKMPMNMSEIKSDDYKLSYYPLLKINTLIKWLYERSFVTKMLSILVCVIILIGIDLVIFVLFKCEKKGYDIELKKEYIFFFKHEKLFFIIFYFILNIIMITLPKKGIIRDLMNTKIVIALSRMGFLMSCVVYSATYLSFVVFYLRIKLYMPTFFIISVGNLLIMSLEVLLIYTLIELSFAIVIKRLLKMGRD